MRSSHDYPKIRFSPALLSLTLATSVFVSGCANIKAFNQGPDSVAEPSAFGRDWDNSVGNMGVVAIVPPSEDVMVGDMYVYAFNPDFPVATGSEPLGGGLSLNPRWASLNLLKQLERDPCLLPIQLLSVKIFTGLVCSMASPGLLLLRPTT